jgi:hypothetical protein
MSCPVDPWWEMNGEKRIRLKYFLLPSQVSIDEVRLVLTIIASQEGFTSESHLCGFFL